MTDPTTDAAARYGLDQMPRTLCWAILTPGQTADELAKLTTWVDWLRDRYQLDHRTIPSCWPPCLSGSGETERSPNRVSLTGREWIEIDDFDHG